MGFATTDNSKLVRSTGLIFSLKKDIGVTIGKKQKKTKFQNFGVNGFCQMTAALPTGRVTVRCFLFEHCGIDYMCGLKVK